jgi:hypothetical protein
MAGAGVNPNKNIQQWPKQSQNRMKTPTGLPPQPFLQQSPTPYQWQAQQPLPPYHLQAQSPTRDPRMIQWLQQMQQYYGRR